VEIVAKDVVGGNTTAQTLVYMEDGEEKEAAISGATLVYNGRVRPMDASLLKPAIGTVRLVSETGADYNLVVVESYRNYIIESVLIDTKTVYFKNGEAPMVIDFTDNNVNIVLTDEKGAPLGLDELVEGDILSVCRDAEINTSVYRMYRSYRTVEGTIRELSEEEVTIDETIYPIAYSADPAAFRLGEKALFHLDFTGAVADVSEPEGSGRTYAWLQMAKNTVGVNPEPQLKLFTQDGEWKVFQTADYVEVNGATVAAKDLLNPGKPRAQMYLADQAPSLVDDTGAVERQLIAYETNEEGLLTKIETAYNKTRLDTADEDKVGGTFSMDFYQNDTRHSRFFDGTKPGSTLGDPGVGYDGYLEYDGTMFTKVFIRAETKYFVIPGDITNEKAFFTKKATNEIRLETIRRDDTDCQCFFDVKDNYICGAVVLRKDIQAQGTAIDDSIVEYPSYDKPAGLVLGVSRALNEDGMATTNLKVYNNSGQEVLLNLEDIEVLQYRNANARMWDEVVNGQTLKGDPAWYMLREDGTKYQPEKTSSVWKGTRIETRVNEIFMDLEALSPGDVVQYEADDSGNLLRVCVVYRCEYPGNLEFAYGGDGLRSTGLMVNYRGGNLSLNGTVKKVMDSGILTEVVLPEGTYGDYSYGLSSGIKTTRMLPNQGKMVVWNTDKQQMQVISMADVVKGDFIYSWWQTNVQNLFIVYR